MFTEGTEIFDKAHEENIFDKIYTTNLTYINKNILKKEWIKVVDCSKKIAGVINLLNNGKSISPILDDKTKFFRKIENLSK